jgi:GTP cyclohydrolase I
VFLSELAEVISARTSGHKSTSARALYVSDNWASTGGGRQGWRRKHGFQQEDHRSDLVESKYVNVKRVSRVLAGKKPFTVYSFTCDRGTFLISGHLSHNCAHHGLPFFGEAAIGYIPGKKIVGLSKFARVLDHFAHRFTVQENLTHYVAEYMEKRLKPVGLGVVIRAEHMCMSMRGVERPNHTTITSDMRGAFRSAPHAKAELLALIGAGK